MDDNRTGALFPLPLTPFERYYLADDRPDYPTTCPLEMRFSGQLQREPFLKALREVIGRHPLLAARVADGPNGPQWVPSGQSEPAFDWADESIAIDPPGGEYLDLRVAAGLRTWVRTSADTTRVLMQFHHACCDGLAIFQVAEDLLVLYAAAFAGRDAGLAAPALERLRDRGAVDLTGAPKPSLTIAIRDVWVTAQIWSSVLFRTCAVVAEPTQPRTNTASPSAHPSKTILAFETQVLDRDESRKYAELAAALGVTVNDLLLRDGLVALRQWSQRQGHARLGACRVNVPVYVRGRASGDIPASNGIGFAFVSANPDKIADGGALLGEVHRQMELVKNRKLALYFLGGLAAAAKIKPIVPWALKRRRSFATTVLSYLGRVLARTPLPRQDGRLVAGNVVLERVGGVPPVRPLTRAAIVVLEYAGEISISLRCDPHLFTPGDTRALLEIYVSQIRETIRGAK